MLSLRLSVAKSLITSTEYANMRGSKKVESSSKKNQRDQASNHESEQPSNTDALENFAEAVISMSTQSDDLCTLLLSQIAAYVHQIPGPELPALWVPFFQSLVGIIATYTKETLNTQPCQQLFSVILKTYLGRYSSSEPTSDESTLVRPDVDCCGMDCAPLNAFLIDGSETLAHFPLKESRRKHLEQRLERAQVDCVTNLLRSGSSYALVVTKTFRGYLSAEQNWAHRQQEAVDDTNKFDQTYLSVILGADYKGVVKTVALMEASIPSQLLDPPEELEPESSPSPPLAKRPHPKYLHK